MQIYCYDPDYFQSLDEAFLGGGRISAVAVLFEVAHLWADVEDQSVPPQIN